METPKSSIPIYIVQSGTYVLVGSCLHQQNQHTEPTLSSGKEALSIKDDTIHKASQLESIDRTVIA